MAARVNIQDVKVKEMESKNRNSVITSNGVSWKFNIGIEKAKGNLRVKTQKEIMHTAHPLHHIYRVDNMQLNRIFPNAQFYTDHLLAKTNSFELNIGAWIYTTGKFNVAYPYKKRSEVGNELQQFADDVCI